MPTRVRACLPLVLAAGTLALAGCTTSNPQAARSALQKQISERTGADAAWPLTAGERRQTAEAVHALLAKELTAESAVRVALLNNHGLRATFEEIGVSQAELSAASRLPNPTLSAQVRWPSQSPRGPNSEFNLAFSLLDSVLLPLRRRMAAQEFAAAQSRVLHETLALVAGVKSAVYACQAALDTRDRLATIAEINAASADLARRQFDAGNINQLEYEQWLAAASEAALESRRAEVGVQAAREKINRLLGLDDAQLSWTLGGDLPAPPSPEIALDSLEELALRQRPDLAAARTEATLASQALNLKRKTRYLPVGINVGVNAEHESDGNNLIGPNIELGLPLFDQGQGDISRLSAHERRTRERVADLESAVRSDVRSARAALLAAREAAEFYRTTLLPQRERIVKATLLHYNAMQKSPYELLAAKEKQQAAELAAIDARRDYWIARTELERAVGGVLPSHP